MKKRRNSHNNLILNGVTLAGDIVICLIVYSIFLYNKGLWCGENTKISILVVGLIYSFFVLNGGVILNKRNTRDFQIPLLVLKNVVFTSIAAIVLMRLAECSLLTMKETCLFTFLVFVGSSVYRLLIRFLVKAWRIKNSHNHRVVLVGSTSNNMALYKELIAVPYLGYKVNGYFDYQVNPNFPMECRYLGTPDEVIDYLKQHSDVEELYCSLPSRYQDVILPIIHYCVNNLVHFYSVPNVRNYLHHRMYFNMLGDVPYLSLYKEPLMYVENRFVKRIFDILFSLTFLCTLFPIVLLVVTIITKITMPGPVFFQQKRNGLNDKVFYCLKFRSMKVNDEADTLQATKNDPRTTKWGEIMRKTNIDEFPQFINVLKGEMSVVGPRPHMLKHTEEYSRLIDKYMVRHFIKPGITGWSQVTGYRGETRELSQMEGRIRGDIWYIEHWSFGLDLYIIYRTIVNALGGDKGAY